MINLINTFEIFIFYDVNGELEYQKIIILSSSIKVPGGPTISYDFVICTEITLI